MKIQLFPSGPLNTNCIVLESKTNNDAIIIDPAPNSYRLVSEHCQNLNIKYILITHSHWDHIADAYLWKGIAPIAVHSLDRKNLLQPGSDGVPTILKDIQGVEADMLLYDGQRIAFTGFSLEIIHTPGHSPGSVCFYIPEAAVLISGDTLFAGSMGRVSFPGSSPKSMVKSLKKLGTLPPDTKVIPGHGSSTTILNESWIKNSGRFL